MRKTDKDINDLSASSRSRSWNVHLKDCMPIKIFLEQ